MLHNQVQPKPSLKELLVRICVFCVFCVPLLATQAWSQARPTSKDEPSAGQARAEVFGGFSLAGGGLLNTGYGFNGGLDVPVASRIFVVVDVNRFIDQSISPVNPTSETVYLFGPRYLVPIHPNSRTSIFGELLLGGDTFHNGGQAYTYAYNSATGFAFAGEGGLDYALSRHLSTRFEGGYLRSTFHYSTYGGPVSPATTANNRARFAANFVYRF